MIAQQRDTPRHSALLHAALWISAKQRSTVGGQGKGKTAMGTAAERITDDVVRMKQWLKRNPGAEWKMPARYGFNHEVTWPDAPPGTPESDLHHHELRCLVDTLMVLEGTRTRAPREPRSVFPARRGTG
jgi:hypothetical protein